MKRFLGHKRRRHLTLPEKANRVLNVILILFLLVTLRLWHVAVTQHQQKCEEAQKPQRRVVIKRANRGSIVDRFGRPLAINKVQYNASISYARIREVPRTEWRRDKHGKKIKIFKRKIYIAQLATYLAKELNLDAEEIEDLIHAKASVFGAVPFLIKENISEEKYFRLKMAEKDWPGVHAEIVAKRCYPMGRAGSSVVGYMGAISKERYQALTKEMRELREFLKSGEEGIEGDPHPFFSLEEAKKRLEQLEAKAYTINDFVGKTGAEAAFDERLKGWQGKRTFLSDIRGRYLQELPGGADPKGGDKIQLAISTELQEYAEALLVEYEGQTTPKKELYPENHPWQKGGAIVVMEPNTGHVLALASTPRFDANDFIRMGSLEEKEIKRENVARWLESDRYLGEVYDGVQPLVREQFSLAEGCFYDEEIYLTWDRFIGFLFPKEVPIRRALKHIVTLKDAVTHQLLVERLLSHFLNPEEMHYPHTARVIDFLYPKHPTNTLLPLQDKEHFSALLTPEVAQLQAALDTVYREVPNNADKLLVADLCRLAVDPKTLGGDLLKLIGPQSLNDFKQASSAWVQMNTGVKKIVKQLYKEHDFSQWRQKHFKSFLIKKREEEKRQKRYAKPYIDYLKQEEERQFAAFYETHKLSLMVAFLTLQPGFAPKEASFYEQALLTWAREITQGGHSALKWVKGYLALKEITDEFHPSCLKPYLKVLRGFSTLKAPLWGCYVGLRSDKGVQQLCHLACAFYPKYGYGVTRPCSFAQATRIGSIFKLIPSYAVLMQRYNEGKRELNPLVMVDDKRRVTSKNGGWIVGYDTSGKPIPMYYRGGRLPRSDHSGIGRIDLIRALETSSNPFFSLVAGDILHDPEDLCHAASLFSFGAKTGIALPGEFAGYIPRDVSYNKSGLYSMAIGQHSLLVTPLQTAVMLSALANGGHILQPQVLLEAKPQAKWALSLPKRVRDELILGMKQVVQGEKGTGRILRFGRHLSASQKSLTPFVIGKTSTAQVGARLSLDSSAKNREASIIKDVGFGAIYFEDMAYKKPKLVVVVFLRRGDWGKLAAPLALKMIDKCEQLFSGSQ